MRINVLFFICFLHFHLTNKVLASEGIFYIEEKLVSKMYDSVVTDSISTRKKTYSISPELNTLKIDSLNLKNRYFESDYSQLGRIPFFHLELSKLLDKQTYVNYKIAARLGYGYIENKAEIHDNLGLKIHDVINLQMIPLEISSSAHFKKFSKTLVPSINFGIGRSWIHQGGQMDGFDKAFYISNISIGASLNILLSKVSGLTTNSTIISGIKSSHEFRAWRLGLGAWLII